MKNDTSARICALISGRTAEMGWTGVDLARESGVSYRTIHAILHNQTNPRPINVQKIARALGSKVADLGMPEVPDLAEEAPASVAEPRVRYDAEPKQPTVPDHEEIPPLHAVLDMMARHLGVKVEEVIEFAVEKLKGRNR